MALEGTLQDMSLTDLFQVFRLGPKSGVLLLARETRRGVIYVLDGRLIDAAIVQMPNRQVMVSGEDAVLHLLAWENASFTFRADSAVASRPVRIERDSETLVIEAMRLHDQSALPQSHQSLALDTKLVLTSLPSSASGGLSLDLEQWRVLSQVSISENVGDLCQKCGMPVDVVLRLLSELIAIGLIDVIQPQRQVVRTPSEPLSRRAVGGHSSHNGTTQAERGLLSAIMRRIRSL